MVVLKRKKASRQRGNKTHGWGAKKKHRGAGNKGGRGRAGSGKRADSKKPSIWKNKDYFGKRGFNRKPSLRQTYSTINIYELDARIDDFVKKGWAEKKGDSFVVDFTKLGYDKLLGKGKTDKKFIITIEYASQKAREKIERAGGKISLVREALASEEEARE